VVIRLREPGWVEVRAEVVAPDDESPADARRRALAVARCAAVEDVAGISVTAATVSFQSLRGDEAIDLFQVLGLTRAEAVIVDERPGTERVLPLGSGRGYRFEVTLKARVVDRRRDADPGFKVEVDLGRERFRVGEDVSLAVRSTRDARLFVVDVSDRGAALLLPNEYQRDTRVRAGEWLRFPGDALSEKGVSLSAQALPGHSRSVETLVVVAVRGGEEMISLRASGAALRLEEATGAVKMLGDLLAPLATMAPSDWTIAQVPYEVWSR
jgi:hypothetical protein